MWLRSHLWYFLLQFFWIQGGLASGFVLERDTVTAAPNCSISCILEFTTAYCGSLSNTACICSNAELTNAVSSCAYEACSTNPELLQLQKYAAVACGVGKEKSRLNAVLMMDCIVPILTALFLGGRIFARVRLHVGLAADDWTIVIAAGAYFVSAGLSLGLVFNDFGMRSYWLDVEQLTTGRKLFYVGELFYMISITMTKLALLLFFLRIFPNLRLRQIVWITGLFIILSNLSILLAQAFQCVPIHANWTNWKYKVEPIQCINLFATLEAAALFSILQSIVILVIPIPTIWRLNLVWKKKANLMIMFSVGFIALVCSFMRLPTLIRLDKSYDLSYDQAPVVVYSQLEQSVGIICACLPACRSLLEHFFPSLKVPFGDTSPNTTRAQTNRTQSSRPPRSRKDQCSSTKSLVELNEHPDVDEDGGGRPKTRASSFNDDFDAKNDADKYLGIQATVKTGPSLGATNGSVEFGIYMTKSVEMVTDKL